MQSDFYITLVSNTTEPKTNKCNDFTVHLCHPVSLAGDWEVCLSEIQYCKSWVNLPCEFEEETKQKTTHINVDFSDDSGLLTVSIPSGHYNNVPDLLATIDKACKEAADEYSEPAESESAVTRKARVHEMFSFTYDPVLDKVTVHLNKANIYQLILSDYLKFMLGFESRTLTFDKETAKFSPDLTAGITALFIYTNIIEGELVGDQRVPLLRIVHVESDTKQNSSVEKIFFSEHYVRVLSKYITSIRIQIMSDAGKPIMFGNGKCYLKLKFRPCRLVGF